MPPILPPPVYGLAPQNLELGPTPQYFPTIPGKYRRPGLSLEVRQELAVIKKEKINEAFNYLAALDPSKSKIRNSSSCVTHNSFINLFSYLCCNKLDILRRAFCCYLDKEQSLAPVPGEASSTLELTREQFDRNTLGVCCIAPACIAATPFIPGSATVSTLLEILSGLVITTTAGTNTYVFSGDIGVVPDGRGGLCVQGGIRVGAIALIQNAYTEMAESMTERWNIAVKNKDEAEKQLLGAICHKIIKNWDFMYEEIANIGLNSVAVEDILAKFATSLDLVCDGLKAIEPDNSVKDSVIVDINLHKE